ncbi:COX15/CtaA family protein [Akkermansiaceae bacterium]|nr:COX15/CtaA family protein [Akkermansiaceae bacterium]
MRRTGVQRLAFLSLVFVIILVFVGAIVRVTGAGLGCPDWPKCWGELIPPWKVEQVDPASFSDRKLQTFKNKAERLGRDPDLVTRESLKDDFNPVHTWTEFINRLFALPVTISSLALLVAGLRNKRLSGRVRKCAVMGFVLVMVNALLGAAVVFSGLHTGVITAHLIAAFILLLLLTYVVWAGAEKGSKLRSIDGATRGQVGILLAVVLLEGFLGAQIREMTDELQMKFGTDSRESWIMQIEDSLVFLVHRSFSWVIFGAALFVGWKVGWRGVVPRLVLVIVFAFMLMGIIFTHVQINAVVQVLHVGLASVLVSLVFYWWLAANQGGRRA